MYNLPDGAGDNGKVERELPVLEIGNIRRDPLSDVRRGPGLAAEPPDLREAGDPRLHEGANVVIGKLDGELCIVLHQMRPGPTDTHLAFEHIHELRQLVDA